MMRVAVLILAAFAVAASAQCQNGAKPLFLANGTNRKCLTGQQNSNHCAIFGKKAECTATGTSNIGVCCPKQFADQCAMNSACAACVTDSKSAPGNKDGCEWNETNQACKTVDAANNVAVPALPAGWVRKATGANPSANCPPRQDPAKSCEGRCGEAARGINGFNNPLLQAQATVNPLAFGLNPLGSFGAGALTVANPFTGLRLRGSTKEFKDAEEGESKGNGKKQFFGTGLSTTGFGNTGFLGYNPYATFSPISTASTTTLPTFNPYSFAAPATNVNTGLVDALARVLGNNNNNNSLVDQLLNLLRGNTRTPTPQTYCSCDANCTYLDDCCNDYVAQCEGPKKTTSASVSLVPTPAP